MLILHAFFAKIIFKGHGTLILFTLSDGLIQPLLTPQMIGIFNDNFPPIMDGVGITAKNYADYIAASGNPVCVVTAAAPQADYNLPYPVLHYKSIPVPKRKPYRYGYPPLDFSFRRAISNVQFSLIHAHCPFATGQLALSLGKKRHIPVVATFHSKYRQDFERVIPSKWIVDKVIDNIVNFYNQADEVWIPQASVEPTLREYGYKGRVEVVDNGNDLVTPPEQIKLLRADRRRLLGLRDDEIMLLFVGQHICEKNIGLILDSLALIRELPFKLYTIGTGYATNAIRDKVRQLGLQDKVELLGSIYDREQLKSYYAAADLFLFPSLYDNAPLVVREAAALLTPAVMLQGSTAAEIISDGDNGFLCPNDVSAYADTLRHLISNPEFVKRVGEQASRTITRSWEDVVNEVLGRYQQIIERYSQKQ